MNPFLHHWPSSVFRLRLREPVAEDYGNCPGLLLHLDWANASVLRKRLICRHRLSRIYLITDAMLIYSQTHFCFQAAPSFTSTIWHESTPKQEARDVVSRFSHSISSWE